MKSIGRYRYILIVLFAILVPFSIAAILLFSINLTFWYDNSRDLLTAWDNLHKFTLIGPPSGIPGIFYGPYWIWLLSIGLFISKNPLVVTFITATFPYFILFPLLWFRFSNFFGRTAVLVCWLLFMFSNGLTYGTQLWNLYPAPLITLAIIYLLIISEFTKITKKQTLIAALVGFLMGLLINFHISFGISFLCGTAIYLIIDAIYSLIKRSKNTKQNIFITKIFFGATIIIGLFISFLPTLLFEARHGFHQTQTLLHTLSKFGAVVSITGLNRLQILQNFIKTFGDLLHIPILVAGIIVLLLIVSLIFLKYKQKVTFNKGDFRIMLLLGSLFTGNLIIYLTAKNPIWGYHFIAVDVLSLLLLTFFASKLSWFRKGLVIYTIGVVCISVFTFVITFHKHDSHYEQQLDVVNSIRDDAKSTDYTVFAYNPAIYSYDFSYLFKWMAHKDFPYDPGMIKQSANTIYIIIPQENNAEIQDFIHFRSQPNLYKKVKSWKTEDAYAILKFVKR